ncbi:hypothetical protein SLS64_001021 [Diaporthe eres]|uniref:Uncharacterized protein n=1 Tax=Diaporthe eres TaxID=83184 RepID=A0ABR1NZJ7_DIAER
MASSGIIYHTLFKTALPLSKKCSSQVSQRLNSLVFKMGASPGLIYAESGDLRRLQVFATEVQRQSRGARTFTPIVPPMEAPVFAQARLADSAFSKVADVEGMDAFGAEMVKRGLEHFWIDVNRQQLFSARS